MDAPEWWCFDEVPEPDSIILRIGADFYEVSWEKFIDLIKQALEGGA
jgi:hypothetical protein